VGATTPEAKQRTSEVEAQPPLVVIVLPCRDVIPGSERLDVSEPVPPHEQRTSEHLRADARRNRARLLEAARWLFVEQGLEVPLDAVAARADVGIATLYRRFPDRDALIEAVALDTIGHFETAAATAFEAERRGEDGFEGFVRATDPDRLGVLLPVLAPVIADRRAASTGLQRAAARAIDALDDLVTAAQRNGVLRRDVGVKDVMLLLALVTRPLDGPTGEQWETLAPRLLHLALEGLRAEAATEAPPPPDPDTWFDAHAE
jgi:AcrR family transcriptional regulator